MRDPITGILAQQIVQARHDPVTGETQLIQTDPVTGNTIQISQQQLDDFGENQLVQTPQIVHDPITGETQLVQTDPFTGNTLQFPQQPMASFGEGTAANIKTYKTIVACLYVYRNSTTTNYEC